MRAAHHIGAQHPHLRQHEARLGIAGAERAEALDQLGEIRRRRRGAARRRSRARAPARRAQHLDGARARGNRAAPAAFRRTVKPAAMAWPPPLTSSPAWRAAITAGPSASPGHRAARALADRAVKRDDAGRAVVAFLEPARDDADDAGMPALARDEDQQRAAAAVLDLRDRLRQNARLDLAPLGVVGVELLRQARASSGSSVDEQPRAEIGRADPAAGIDPRPQDEAGVIGADRARRCRHVGQRREARIGAPPHHLEPLRHQRAVEAGQRHHVADRAERHEIEPVHQIGLAPAARTSRARAARG